MSQMKSTFAWLLVGSVASIGVAATASGAIAQTAAPGAMETLGTDDDGDSFFGESGSPFELIHRAILAPNMSAEEYFETQNRAINSEAEDFRLRQQEALRSQPDLLIEDPDEISVDGEAL